MHLEMNMQLVVPFTRAPGRAEVLGDRLDRFRAHAVAEIWRYRLRPDGAWRQYHVGDYETPPTRKDFIEWASVSGHPTERIVRAGRGQALWVLVRPGKPYDAIPQSLTEVAELRNAGLKEWGTLIERYGLPRRDAEWVVIDRTPIEGEDPLDYRILRAEIAKQYESFELHRIPLWHLQQLPEQADTLIASEKSVLGVDDSQSDKFFGNDPYWRDRLPKTTIARALESALNDLEPMLNWSPAEKGIPDTWGLYAWGWWPLLILREFVHKSRYAPPVKCAASGCSRLVPTERLIGRWVGDAKGAHYCSERCRQREKKRRQRNRDTHSRKTV